ncbi:peptidyl-tRNA hydrolase [Corynebacterium tapiri]|uniref:peptidyl-tRNA hydrolase n=1 Tax=Corynebacterium tapiri TaxID=1448266 RepID=A0A5C4U1P4_9CORY|nr:peptidyl-tRNA hydrolase [Corynebacterium tapiri]TNL95636.1 ACR protein [Corynebacterium tapiri]
MEALETLAQSLQTAGHEDPDDPATVQAMQIVLHIPKSDPPQRHSALAAAAQACMRVCLADDFARQLKPWYDHRIRKVTRRARNSGWDNAQRVPGVTVEVDGAQARAFAPSAVHEVPAPISKLQVKGTDLEMDSPDPAPSSLPLLLIDARLTMSAGKAAAQAGHAAMLLAAQWYRSDPSAATAWALAGCSLSVREVGGELFDRAAALPEAAVVQDAGFTEVVPGSLTALGLPSASLLR